MVVGGWLNETRIEKRNNTGPGRLLSAAGRGTSAAHGPPQRYSPSLATLAPTTSRAFCEWWQNHYSCTRIVCDTRSALVNEPFSVSLD